MVFQGSRLGFHGSRWVFMVIQGSRSVFMVFHGSESVFMVFKVGGRFFKVPGRFFMVFHDSRSFFMVPGQRREVRS